LEFLQLGIIGEYIYSEQLSGEKKGFTLPFSPPATAIFNAKLHTLKWKFIENPYFSVDYRVAAAQNLIVPPEVPTPGYQMINLGLGGGIKMGSEQIFIAIQVQNLLNTKYFNHTSYYRLINLPEQGLDFIVNISIPISGKFKNK
jgi:iron complex outermembrane receptor protein